MNSENIESFVGFVLPTIQDFVFLLVFVGVIVLGQRMLNIDGDLSNSMTGKSLTLYEFLSQLFFSPLHRIGGINLIVYGCGVVMVISFKLFYKIFWQLSGTMFAGLGVDLLVIFSASLYWLTRPLKFTIFLSYLDGDIVSNSSWLGQV